MPIATGLSLAALYDEQEEAAPVQLASSSSRPRWTLAHDYEKVTPSELKWELILGRVSSFHSGPSSSRSRRVKLLDVCLSRRGMRSPPIFHRETSISTLSNPVSDPTKSHQRISLKQHTACVLSVATQSQTASLAHIMKSSYDAPRLLVSNFLGKLLSQQQSPGRNVLSDLN